MKKSFLFIVGAAAILAGCNREATVETPEVGRKHIIIQASVNPETRTTLTIDGNEGSYAWTEDEQIAVFESTAEAATSFTVCDIENGYFEGDVNASNTLVGAVSPLSAVSEVIALEGDVEYTLSFPGLYQVGQTNAIMVAAEPQTVTNGGETMYKFQFRHAAGVIKVTYANVPIGTAGLRFTAGGTISGEAELTDLSDVEVRSSDLSGAPEGTASVAYVLFDDPVTEPNTTQEFYLPIPMGEYEGFTIALVDDMMNPIPGTDKSKNVRFEVERADVIVIPTVTLQAVDVSEKFIKVTRTSDITDGDYLIVYEGNDTHDAVAFKGSLETLDGAENGMVVAISNGAIDYSNGLNDNVFTISVSDGTIKSKSGYYIGVSSNSNALKQTENAETYTNTFSINESGEAIISASFEGSIMSLRYNYSSGDMRFRYYKNSGQQPIALYKLGTAVSADKLPAGISFAEGSPFTVSITDAEDFTAPQLSNPNNLAITWSIEDEDEIALFDDEDGTLLLTGDPGIITVTAQSAETSVFAAGSASYTVEVVAPITVYGTVDNPVALEDVVAAIDDLDAGEVTSDFYYVGGIVSTASSSLYSGGKLTFVFGDDDNDIKAYNCLGLDGVAFTSKDDVKVGDYVVVYGNLEKYVKNNITTYEVVNCHLAKLELAPYFTATISSQSFESTGGTAVLSIAANVPWTATINNGGSLRIGDASASNEVSGSTDTDVTVIIPTNNNGATYTISFSTTSETVTVPAAIQIVQDAYVDLVTAVATFTGKKSGGMTGSQGGQTGVRRNVTATISSGLADVTNDHIRVYKNATLTLSVPSGAYITGIEFTGLSSNPVSNFGTHSGLTTDGDNGSWSGNAQSVTFTASVAQVRLAQIDVTYRIAEGQLVNYTPIINVTSSNPLAVANTASSQTITYSIDDAPASAVLSDVTKSNGASWISNIDYSTSGVVTFDVAAQETGADARSATLTLKYTGAVDVPVTINQEAGPTQGGGSNFTAVPNQTITFSNLYNINTALDGTTIDGNNCSLVFNKREGGTATQYYTNGNAVRWYGGGTLAITAATGYKITSIKINYSQTANSVSADFGTYSLTNSIGTWTGEVNNGNTVTFTQSGTTGHCRITSIEIN